MEGLDAYNQQAIGILTSSKLADAMDLTREDPRLVERYGTGSTSRICTGLEPAPRKPPAGGASWRLTPRQ